MKIMNYFFVFLPLTIVALNLTGLLSGSVLWVFSVSILALLFCTQLLTAVFFFPNSSVSIRQNWADFSFDSVGVFSEGNFQWDRLGLFAAALIVLVCWTTLWYRRQDFEINKTFQGILAAGLTAILGALAAQNVGALSSFFIFFFVVKIFSMGLEQGEHLDSSMKEVVANSVFGVCLIWIAMLIMSKEGAEALSQWLLLKNFGNAETVKISAFLLVIVATFLIGGIYPFHSPLLRTLKLDGPWNPFFLAVQPTFSALFLFRFFPFTFATELQQFSYYFVVIIVIFILMVVWTLLAAKSLKDKIFWQQQFLNLAIMVGFFSLNEKGWEGATFLYVQQLVSMPLMLFVSVECTARGGFLGIKNLINSPRLGFCLTSGILLSSVFPFSMGFWGIILIIWSASNMGYLVLIALCFALVMYLFAYREIFLQDMPSEIKVGQVFTDLGYRELVSFLPLFLILLFCGIFPTLIWSPISSGIVSSLYMFH